MQDQFHAAMQRVCNDNFSLEFEEEFGDYATDGWNVQDMNPIPLQEPTPAARANNCKDEYFNSSYESQASSGEPLQDPWSESIDAPTRKPQRALSAPADFSLFSSERDKESCLGSEFEPGEWDVICARGRTSFDHVGNRRFRIIVAINLKRYVEAASRLDKSLVVNSIVKQIRDASPGGGFVRRNSTTGEWYEVGTMVAREKVGHTIRDCLRPEQFRRTSSCSKVERRETLQNAQDEIFRSMRIGSTKKSDGFRRASTGSAMTSAVTAVQS